MIIAFYPGAGGNRYIQYITNREYTAPKIAYDNKNPMPPFHDRYLLDQITLTGKYDLIHCVNYSKIIEMLGSVDITFIKADYKQSLRRGWILNESYKTTLSQVDSAWAYITWHDEYYKKYPFDEGPAPVIDITNDNTNFTTTIKKELSNHSSKIFDFCWDIYYTLGASAPITDLYNNSHDKK